MTDYLFNGELEWENTPKSKKEFGFHGMNSTILDLKTEYSYNSFGYRCKEWNKKAEILAIGCSNTFGVGVPVSGRWTNILEEIIKKEIINLSSPGASIQELVLKAFAYFKNFGNPKLIICLFPDPFRFLAPNVENLIFATNNDRNQNNFSKKEYVYLNSTPTIKDRPKYLKRPYLYSDVLPLEFPLMISLQFIYMLEQYCNSNNIKLIWSSWDNYIQNFLIFTKNNYLNNFIKDSQFHEIIQNNQINGLTSNLSNCCENYKENFFEYFYAGRDVELGFPHPGVHQHIHIAQIFSKYIKELYVY
jgi:hypothetical protein